MNLAQLNAKILAMPVRLKWEMFYLRDERLGILGVLAGQEPTEAQVDLVHAQIFGEPAQKELL